MYDIACYEGDNLLNKRTPVDTETNVNLKIATQKTDVINQRDFTLT